ncbi:tyrosine-type recombinase/integrase, partial [Escherichia coli]
RHTVLTMLAEADVNPDKVRLLTGHEDVRTTLSYYTHTTHEMTRDAVAKLPTYHVHAETEPESEENEPELGHD